MKVKEEKCKFNRIKLFQQNIDKDKINILLYKLYNTFCFSTFPYLIYKEGSSYNCSKKFNSGNCIGFCYFIKEYLKLNYDIESYMIGASVPSLFKVEGTPHICHCAILIPISKEEFYIVDGAIYFLEPIYCNLKNDINGSIYISNVYEHCRKKINYQLDICNKCQLDPVYNQTLYDNSLIIKCEFDESKTETWNYYLNEIINPDNNIGFSFLMYKPQPFLMYTIYEDGIVKLKYKIYYKNEMIIIKSYPSRKQLYSGNGYDNNETFINIKNELNKYFLDFII